MFLKNKKGLCFISIVYMCCKVETLVRIYLEREKAFILSTVFYIKNFMNIAIL